MLPVAQLKVKQTKGIVLILIMTSWRKTRRTIRWADSLARLAYGANKAYDNVRHRPPEMNPTSDHRADDKTKVEAAKSYSHPNPHGEHRSPTGRLLRFGVAVNIGKKKSSRPPLWPPAIFIFYTSLELVLFKSLVEPNKRVRQIIQGYSPPYKRPVLGYLGGGKSAAHHWKLELFTLRKRTRSANW